MSAAVNENKLVWTLYGYAVESPTPPQRRDVHWRAPSEHIYAWDGDGWYRICPPDNVPYHKPQDLPHG